MNNGITGIRNQQLGNESSSYFVVLVLSSFTLESYDGGAGTSSVLDNSTFTLESGST